MDRTTFSPRRVTTALAPLFIIFITSSTMSGCGDAGRAPLAATTVAPVTSGGGPDLVALDVLPPGDLELLGDGAGGYAPRRIIIDGHFSDGSVRDVTALVALTAVDPSIARVGSSGVVEGLADGATTLDVVARGQDGRLHHVQRALVVDAGRAAPGPGGEPERLELWPGPRALTRVDAARGEVQRQRLAVLLVHTDGTRRDVTAEACFDLTDATTRLPSTAAAVGTDGVLVATQDGVTVDLRAALPLAHLAAATRFVLGPTTAPIGPADAWRGEPLASSTNPLDQAALPALRAAGVEPGPLSSDEEWLRRVTTDACGRLPSEAELSAFLLDPAKDKREALVRRLLASPDVATHWAEVIASWLELDWSDAYVAALRSDLERGMTLSDVVTKVVTARPGAIERELFDQVFDGDGARNRPAQLFYAFAEMSVRCATCHDHKLAPTTWPQTRGQALFSFFARSTDEARLYLPYSTPAIEPAWDLDPVTIQIPALGADPAQTVEDRRRAFATLFTTSAVFHRGLAHRVATHVGLPLLDPRRFIETPRSALAQPLVLDVLATAMKDAGTSLPTFLEVLFTSRLYQLSTTGLTTRHDRLLARHTVARHVAQVAERGVHEALGLTWAPDDFFRAQFGGRASRATNLSQPLVLMNGPHGPAGKLGLPGTWVELLAQEVVAGRRTLGEAVDSLFRRALTRDPTAAERAAVLAELQGAAPREALEDVAMALFQSAEFALRR